MKRLRGRRRRAARSLRGRPLPLGGSAFSPATPPPSALPPRSGPSRALQSYSAKAVRLRVFVRETSLPDVRQPFTLGCLLVAPNVRFIFQTAARGEFPFRFGGQTFVRPVAVGHRVFPTDMNHWIFLATADVGVR